MFSDPTFLDGDLKVALVLLKHFSNGKSSHFFRLVGYVVVELSIADDVVRFSNISEKILNVGVDRLLFSLFRALGLRFSSFILLQLQSTLFYSLSLFFLLFSNSFSCQCNSLLLVECFGVDLFHIPMYLQHVIVL